MTHENDTDRLEESAIDRRTALVAVGSVTSWALAGCTGDDTDDDDGDDDATGGMGGDEEENVGDADSGMEDGGDGDGSGDGPGDGSDGDDGTSDDTSDAEYVDETDGQVELAYGAPAELSNGVEVTVHGVEFETEMGEETPEEGEAFALAEIESYNGGDGQARLPADTDPDIYLLFEDRQVEPTYNFGAFSATDYQPYEGAEVQSDVRREGYVLFETSGGLSQSNVDFLWQDEIFVAEDLDGAIDVLWTEG